MKIFFDPTYNDTDIDVTTLRKAEHLFERLDRRPVPGTEVLAPRPATLDEVLTVHDPDYVRDLREGGPLGSSNGLGWDGRLWDAVTASTGGLLAAVEVVLAEGGVAGSLSSGLHHARAGRGSGCCTINGLAIAARVAVQAGVRRVVILDVDAHCGGGTHSLIEGDGAIEQVDVSVSSFDRYVPAPGNRLVLADAADYLAIIERELVAIDDPSGIGLLIVNAGVDPHEGAGGLPGITAEVLAQRERMIFGWAARHGIPTAWVLAGGYTIGIDMDALVELHVQTIEAAVEAFAPGAVTPAA